MLIQKPCTRLSCILIYLHGSSGGCRQGCLPLVVSRCCPPVCDHLVQHHEWSADPLFLQYGCLVVNAPTANTVAAAEHGIALMCALARNIAQADASMKAGKWERNKYVGASLVDKTLAIMGFGKVSSGSLNYFFYFFYLMNLKWSGRMANNCLGCEACLCPSPPPVHCPLCIVGAPQFCEPPAIEYPKFV